MSMGRDEGWQSQLRALGDFIKQQRQRARLSLRDLAERTQVSNAYLSQIERGLHEPSMRVLKALGKALDVSAEVLLSQAGLLEGDDDEPDTIDVEAAIRGDSRLTGEQQQALIAVYRSYVEQNV
jgi:transcriptional regulator with XRE-family HTH domain